MQKQFISTGKLTQKRKDIKQLCISTRWRYCPPNGDNQKSGDSDYEGVKYLPRQIKVDGLTVFL
jgi:hypothetical protein